MKDCKLDFTEPFLLNFITLELKISPHLQLKTLDNEVERQEYIFISLEPVLLKKKKMRQACYQEWWNLSFLSCLKNEEI